MGRWGVVGLVGALLLAVAAPVVSPSATDTAAAAPPGVFADFVAPADTVLVVDQPDGSTFRAKLTPAELGGALEVDGYSVVKGTDGWWRYAARRGTDGLEAGSARVGVESRPKGLRPGVGRTRSVWADGSGGDVRAQLLRQLQIASREASLQAAAAGGGPRVFRFPVVMFATWYDPELGQTAPQFQEGNTVEHYEAILDGFGGNPTGTLTEFYFENSYGQLLVQVDVLAQPDGSPYVSTRSSVPGDEGRCYYGGIDPPPDPLDDLDPLDSAIGAGGGGALGMAIEAFNLTSLPFDHDFSVYDNDGDSSIDFLGIIHTGAEMAVTGDPCNTWSHAISVSTFSAIAGQLLQDLGLPIPDTGTKLGLPVPGQSVTYDRLFTMPEFETRDGILTIGVAAHEMAHALGEPDYYGTDGSTSGDGEWDIMAGGSYGGTPSGSNPTWFNPASRVFQGWVTPTIVHEDMLDVTLQRRSSQPEGGYSVGEPNPNLLLVPTKWINVGDTDELGHVWTDRDVYGLVQDGDRGYVIEGFYLEFASRMPVRSDAIHSEMTRESYFDRWALGSGLLTWHFDYWRQSNVLYGQNGANNDPNRMQMDVEEWDFNDNTQEIALNLSRGEPSDVAWDAATGITSGTHRPNPGVEIIEGEPQGEITIPPGPVTPVTPYDFAFEVEPNPANRTMRVTINTELSGDCTLQLLYGPPGEEQPQTEVVDAGFVGAAETATITNPAPGRWVARMGDFLLCGAAAGTVTFSGPSGFDATGTADTWSNWTEEPTGWAFTNIRTGGSEGLAHGSDAGGPDAITIDVLRFGDVVDVSPGFARPAENAEHGRVPVVAGQQTPFSVPVFSNGATAPGAVGVEVREGSEDGPVVASGTVTVDGYESELFEFAYDPGGEGGFDLVTVVDPAGAVSEAHESNNVQRSSGWAGPAAASVLVVDDDGPGDAERMYAGALAALGIPYAIAERHVAPATMDAYDAVIWVATLDRFEGQLDPDDQLAIATYLGGGGKLWLASNRAIEALGSIDAATFAANWFGVNSADIASYYEPVRFVTTDILGSGEVLLDPLPGRPFIDQYELASENVFGTAASLGYLDGTGTAADGVAILGARVDGETEGGSFQTVTTAFSLSQVADPGRAIALARAVMDHFGVAGGGYAVEGDDPLIYHSQPRQTPSGQPLPIRAIVLGGEPGQPVTLFYRRHAIGDYRPVPMTPMGEQGAFKAEVPSYDVTPDGVDYYLRAGQASTFEPRAAASGSLANAVAVFMPEVTEVAPPVPIAPPPVPPVTSEELPRTGGGAWPRVAMLVLAAAVLAAGMTRRRMWQR